MTDKQYELIDELYFIQNADSLQGQLGWTRDEVIDVLLQVFDNGWLKVMYHHDEEVEVSKEQLALQITEYGFIVSKKGLFAHNSN